MKKIAFLPILFCLIGGQPSLNTSTPESSSELKASSSSLEKQDQNKLSTTLLKESVKFVLHTFCFAIVNHLFNSHTTTYFDAMIAALIVLSFFYMYYGVCWLVEYLFKKSPESRKQGA